MKIAMPVLQYNKEGGIERHTWELVERWSRDNDIHIFASEWAETTQKVTFHKVPTLKRPELLRIPSFVLNNSVMLKNGDFDIVFNNGCGATFVQDVIVAASLHKAWAEETKKAGLKRFFLNPMHYWTFAIERFNYRRKRYRKIIAISEFIKKRLIDYYGLPDEDIVVIHHGVNLEEFNPSKKGIYRAEIRKSFGIAGNDLLLVFTGKEFRRKGLQYVFQALGKLRDERVKLIVVGSGEISQFRAIAQRLGIDRNIFFIGHSSDVARYYAASDVFILPSTFDAFGMVVLEAMASGLPVIVSRNMGASEIVADGEEGIVLKNYFDYNEIAESVRWLIETPSLKGKWGANARSKAEKFSWDIVAEKTLEVLYDVYYKRGGEI